MQTNTEMKKGKRMPAQKRNVIGVNPMTNNLRDGGLNV